MAVKSWGDVDRHRWKKPSVGSRTKRCTVWPTATSGRHLRVPISAGGTIGRLAKESEAIPRAIACKRVSLLALSYHILLPSVNKAAARLQLPPQLLGSIPPSCAASTFSMLYKVIKAQRPSRGLQSSRFKIHPALATRLYDSLLRAGMISGGGENGRWEREGMVGKRSSPVRLKIDVRGGAFGKSRRRMGAWGDQIGNLKRARDIVMETEE